MVSEVLNDYYSLRKERDNLRKYKWGDFVYVEGFSKPKPTQFPSRINGPYDQVHLCVCSTYSVVYK